MFKSLDDLDLSILKLLQTDAGQSLESLAKQVGSSKTPVWTRIRKIIDSRVIKQQTVILDPEALSLEACFFVLIRTSEHEEAWQSSFLNALNKRPEVMEAHRLAGEIDYILKVRVANARAYDNFYQSLIRDVKVFNVTALLSMEEIKYSTELPIDAIPREG